MLLDRLTAQSGILESALQATSLKNEVIQNNIANNDTPGFKKKTVYFDEMLSDEIDKYKKTGKFDASRIKPRIGTVHRNFNYRLDENNVDIEEEMVLLYQNSIKYDTMVSSVLNNSKRTALAFTIK